MAVTFLIDLPFTQTIVFFVRTCLVGDGLGVKEGELEALEDGEGDVVAAGTELGLVDGDGLKTWFCQLDLQVLSP